MSLPIGADREPCVAPALTPVLSTRWALSWRHAGVVAGFCGLFLLLDILPLGDSRVWLHARHGRYIVEHLALPIADPVQPLAEGMPFVASGWLTQVAIALAAAGGPQQVANLMAALGLVGAMILARVFFLRSGRLSLALAGLAIALVTTWSTLVPACPELPGITCFAALLWLVTKAQRLDAEPADDIPLPSRTMWLVGAAVVVLFVAWANLHDSFFVGVGLLACFAFGRLVEVAVGARSLKRALGDRSVQRWVLLAEGALVATLVNPYGFDLWTDRLRGMQWAELLGSASGGLTLSSFPGAIFVLSLVALVLVFRHSRRRVQPTEIVLLTAFGVAVMVTDQALPWYGMVFVYAIAPHVGDLLSARRPLDVPSEPRRGFAASLASLLAVWCAFAFSPASQCVLGRQHAANNPGLYKAFPASVAEYLHAHPVEGMVFAPARWTNGLAWAGPAETAFVMTSDTDRVPRRVHIDYDNLFHARPGWEQTLRRYQVGLLVIDKQRQPELATIVRSNERWTTVLEDDAVLAVRSVRTAPQTCPVQPGCCDEHQSVRALTPVLRGRASR